MTIEGLRFYPGETASPALIVQLANEYRRAADELRENGRRGEPLSLSPYRLVAIHAIELYLNAYLLDSGCAPNEVRRLQHDLGARTDLALAAKLTLRKRTIQHLHVLTMTREYLLTRYDPTPSAVSQINRLAATLAEVGEKVTRRIGSSCAQ